MPYDSDNQRHVMKEPTCCRKFITDWKTCLYVVTPRLVIYFCDFTNTLLVLIQESIDKFSSIKRLSLYRVCLIYLMCVIVLLPALGTRQGATGYKNI